MDLFFKVIQRTLVQTLFIPRVGSKMCLPDAKFAVRYLWLKRCDCH